MELDFDLKQKLTERILRKIGEPISLEMEDIYLDLIDGKHDVNVMIRGKFTNTELMYERNGYCHHFLGVSAKNPHDVASVEVGIKNALEDSIIKMLSKFLVEEYRRGS